MIFINDINKRIREVIDVQGVYVVSACRTAIGSFGGSLTNISAPKLGSITLNVSLRRAKLEAVQVDEVYMGCVLASGLGQNVARQIALNAGLPVNVPAVTVNMVCGSGMKSIVDGARAIASGDAEIVACGGTENMSASPYLAQGQRWGARMGDATLTDGMIRDGLWDIFNDYHMGVTAENVAEQWKLSREELDEFALASQQKAFAAQKSGRFEAEIVPVEIKVKKETKEFAVDEYPRVTTKEALAKLRPAFKDGGVVTAGNASGINDGAAALILAGRAAVDRHGLKPLARLLGWGQVGVEPSIMGIGPVEASRKALKKAGLNMDDIDLIECNEAFAAQSVAVAKELEFDMEKVNVNGGAIALGHPIGASGARIVVTLLYELQKREAAKKGLAALCIGGGMGIATVFEKCQEGNYA
jgi:acetyl-CoA C-acetyltransferase